MFKGVKPGLQKIIELCIKHCNVYGKSIVYFNKQKVFHLN